MGRRRPRGARQRRNAPAQHAAGQGQPHRRAAALRRTTAAYIFQNADRRIIFAIPYEDDFTLIGTTDVTIDGDPGAGRSDRRRDRLSVRRRRTDYFSTADHAGGGGLELFGRAAAATTTARANAQAATRDYVLELDDAGGAAAVGVRRQDHDLPAPRRSTRSTSSIGFCRRRHVRAATGRAQSLCPAAIFLFRASRRWSQISFAIIPGSARIVRRLARAYGTRARVILDGTTHWSALGRDFGSGLTEAEVSI